MTTDYVTLEQAKAILHRGNSYVYARIADGTLPAEKRFNLAKNVKVWMIDRDSLESLAAQQATPGSETPGYISITEAADLLNITVQNITTHINNGNLRAVKLANPKRKCGFTYRVCAEDVDRLSDTLADRMTEAAKLAEQYQSNPNVVTLNKIATWIKAHSKDPSAYAYGYMPSGVYDALVAAGYIKSYAKAVRGSFTALMDVPVRVRRGTSL